MGLPHKVVAVSSFDDLAKLVLWHHMRVMAEKLGLPLPEGPPDDAAVQRYLERIIEAEDDDD